MTCKEWSLKSTKKIKMSLTSDMTKKGMKRRRLLSPSISRRRLLNHTEESIEEEDGENFYIE